MHKSLRGKVAIVTGASSGIGKAIALALAEAGVRVCLVGRDAARLAQVNHDIEKHKQHAFILHADFAQENSIKQLVQDITTHCKRIDILIHSAGTIQLGQLQEAAIGDFDKQYTINVRAPYLLTQLLLPDLVKSKGQVVFINSTAVLHSGAQVSQYAASKHALKGVADSLRAEVNEQGVRITSIFSGTTATPMQERLHRQKNKPYKPKKLMQPADIAHMVVGALTLPDTSEVTDIVIRPMQKP